MVKVQDQIRACGCKCMKNEKGSYCNEIKAFWNNENRNVLDQTTFVPLC